MKTICVEVIPTTTRQAFKILDDMIPFEKAKEYLSMTKNDFVCNEYFGLGMWVRNNWLLGNEGESKEQERQREACFKMLAGAKSDYGLLPDYDEISSFFLGRYYDHLKRKYPMEVRSLSYEEYLQWKNTWPADMPEIVVDE